MTVSPTAIELCKRFEGFRGKPYRCSAGVPTIGYGTTWYLDGTPVTMEDRPISEAEATILLEKVLVRFQAKTLILCPRLLGENDKRVGAVVSWVYNLGPANFKASTFRRRLNEGRWEKAAIEMRRWVFAGGEKLRGLVIRRDIEATYLLSPD